MDAFFTCETNTSLIVQLANEDICMKFGLILQKQTESCCKRGKSSDLHYTLQRSRDLRLQ